MRVLQKEKKMDKEDDFPNENSFSHFSKEIQIPFRDQLSRFGVKDLLCLEAIGDGSCFFHCICAALNYNNYLFVGKMAQQAMTHKLRCDISSEETDGVALKKRFCTSKEWANEEMINKTSQRLKLNILFLNDRAKYTFYCGIHGGDPLQMPLIVIVWTNHEHFNLLCYELQDQPRPSEVAIKTCLFPTEDPEMIKYIIDTYAKSCSVQVENE